MDYTTIPSLLPAVLTPSAQVAIVDIDGDGYNEVIVLSPDAAQLAVVHQFNYNDISPNDWSDKTVHWWNQWTTAPAGTIAGTAPWIVQTGDVMVAGDFDGDGTTELFLYNTKTLAWALVKWQNGGLTTYWTSTSGCANWTPQAGDTFHLFPAPNGSKAAGLLAFNAVTTTMAIGVLQYAAGSFSASSVTTGGNITIDGWNFHTDDQFIPGFFTSATTSAFLVHASDSYIAALTWDGSAISVTSGQTGLLPKAPGANGQWEVHGNDVMQCLDLNGDGLDEVFTYNPDGYVGALTWVASGFQTLAVTQSVQHWTIGKSDQYLPARLDGSYAILGYNAAVGEAAILELYGGNTFTCPLSTKYLMPNSQWPVTQNLDVYYAGPVTSAATPQLFVISPQSNQATLGGISPIGSLSVTSSVVLPAPGWTPPLLVQAPVTNFPNPPFPTTNECAAYAYASNLFESTNDIRGLYTNSTYAGKFQPFAVQIRGTAYPAGQSFSSSDWSTVTAQIAAECSAVDTVYTTYSTTIPQAATNAYNQQVKDLATVKANIANSLPSGWGKESPVDYWIGQFLVAALWGLAAVTGDAALGAFGSIAASLVGSALTAQPDASSTLQTTYSDIDSAITNGFTNASLGPAVAPAVLLQDPVKLRIFNQLAGSTWNLPLPTTSSMTAYSNADRASMYAQLLPCVYTIGVIPNVIGSGKPFFLSGFPPNPETFHFVGDNHDSYDSVTVNGNPFIYALYVNTAGEFSLFTPNEPGTSLTTDLIAAGVDKHLLLAGQGPWNIPRVPFTNGYFPGSPSGTAAGDA